MKMDAKMEAIGKIYDDVAEIAGKLYPKTECVLLIYGRGNGAVMAPRRVNQADLLAALQSLLEVLLPDFEIRHRRDVEKMAVN